MSDGGRHTLLLVEAAVIGVNVEASLAVCDEAPVLHGTRRKVGNGDLVCTRIAISTRYNAVLSCTHFHLQLTSTTI